MSFLSDLQNYSLTSFVRRSHRNRTAAKNEIAKNWEKKRREKKLWEIFGAFVGANKGNITENEGQKTELSFLPLFDRDD